METIPKIIHQIWSDINRPLPEQLINENEEISKLV